MNYDTIIVELLAKVKILEKRVKIMEKRLIQEGVFDEDDAFDDDWDIEISTNTPEPKEKKMTTEAIRFYINQLIEDARSKDESSITIVARDVHNGLKLKKRYPMVCNAMRQCMKHGDVVIYSPESGYSSTLEIKYYTK